jgi:uncharacterized protein
MVNPLNGVYLTSIDFPEFQGKPITLCVTGDCNLRCTYCYIHHKSNDRDMTFETAKRIIDTMLEHPHEYFDDVRADENNGVSKISGKRKLKDQLTFEMIGGEPFIRTELNDRISKYILYKMLIDNHDFAIMFSFSTNGVNYTSPEVQEYINNYKEVLSIGVTIDGTKKMHDECRVFPEGNGSFEIVKKSVDLWMKQFPNFGTKITISHENLPYISEALIYLWTEVGIQHLPANVVFEDVWTDEDPEIFEEQLTIIANFLLKDENYKKYYTRLFSEGVGKKLDSDDLDPPCGGDGSMLFWMNDGSFYNCIRYAPFSCKTNNGYRLGHLDTGWDEKKIAFLEGMNRRTSSDDECFNCEIASECSYCPGAQFDYFGDPNKRAKFICKMHKARVKVNKYYFDELNKKSVKDYYVDLNNNPKMEEFNNNYLRMSMIKCFIKVNKGEYDVDMNCLVKKMEKLFQRNIQLEIELRSEFLKEKDMNFVFDPSRHVFRNK